MKKECNYGEIIRAARLKKGLTQPQLGERLGIRRAYISNWELNKARPDINIVPRVCRELDLTLGEFFSVPSDFTSLPEDIKELLANYNSLDDKDRYALTLMARSLVEAERHAKITDIRNRQIWCRLSELKASAGTGEWLDDGESYRKICLKRTYETEHTDIVIPVSGDSMEPTFHSGDLLLVQKADTIEEGKIGVFTVNGEGFVKEFSRKGLISHNAKYPVIKILPDDDFRVVGIVLGKVDEDITPTSEELRIMEGCND